MNKKQFKLNNFKLFTYFLIFCFIFPSTSYPVSSIKYDTFKKLNIISKIESEIEIPAGSDYYIKFSSLSNKLITEDIPSDTEGLSEIIIKAIAKSPKWIQRDLTRQFQSIDGEKYANLIIESDIKYVDEIAFSIACSSIGKVPSVDIIKENVLALYENDKFIKYADIIDYNDFSGIYYSTIKYNIIEDEIIKNLEYPPDIYYWYIVHPEISGENAEYIYNEFWRTYLFNHNDIGYPLLKEKLSNIDLLWDCESYFQPANRTWEWSINNHPTAIEAVSYWIGKTITAWAFGDRPNQPNVIAHEHNGYCGELQMIAVAALRTSLIPSVAVCNIGEDHVWREFYERGWHENDNWWADTGGAVDVPEIYAYGWKKDMSSVFGRKGDDSIYDLTSTYIKPEDTKIINFKILNNRLQPVDGVRITVAVKGPKDITYIEYFLTDTLNKIWDFIPEKLKGKILQFFYDKISNKINQIPNSINGYIYSIWNYTDINGNSNLVLGQNKSYTFIIQFQNLKNPILPAKYNKIRILKKPIDKSYTIILPFLKSNIYNFNNIEMPYGEILFNVSFESKSYQIQKKIMGDMDSGIYRGKGKIDFFILDETNFIKYKEGKKFDCYNYVSSSSENTIINSPNKDWYFIFRNNCYINNVVTNISISISSNIQDDFIEIVKPNTNIFDYSIVNIGEIVDIYGIASKDIVLILNGESYNVDEQNSFWRYKWDTSRLNPGEYRIMVKCGNAQDEINIKLIDVIPPIVKINYPNDFEIINNKNNNILNISGYSSDNYIVKKIQFKIDTEEFKDIEVLKNWSVLLDISTIEIGEHIIIAKVIDEAGCISYDYKHIIINETGHSWTPNINYLYSKPDFPTNQSNTIIYANITTNNPFKIKNVVVYWDDGINIKFKDMFGYADYPIQTRHEEDPLKNESNDPIFGLEIGQYNTQTNITYWIYAYDQANNTAISEKKLLIIG